MQKPVWLKGFGQLAGECKWKFAPQRRRTTALLCWEAPLPPAMPLPSDSSAFDPGSFRPPVAQSEPKGEPYSPSRWRRSLGVARLCPGTLRVPRGLPSWAHDRRRSLELGGPEDGLWWKRGLFPCIWPQPQGTGFTLCGDSSFWVSVHTRFSAWREE